MGCACDIWNALPPQANWLYLQNGTAGSGNLQHFVSDSFELLR